MLLLCYLRTCKYNVKKVQLLLHPVKVKQEVVGLGLQGNGLAMPLTLQWTFRCVEEGMLIKAKPPLTFVVEALSSLEVGIFI